MGKVYDMKGIQEVVDKIQERVPHMDGIVVLCLNKDQTTFMVTSKISGQEKAFLGAFYQSFLNRMFDEEMEIKTNGR